ncbi:MAG: RICIN domain-containing protein [Bacteroidaceae bacterium]|nr:RICIN domain-containing protein [Bacteroidaceae bacterium]
MKRDILLYTLLIIGVTSTHAQTSGVSGSVPAPITSDCVVLPYCMDDPGVKLPDITWGLDAAWISEGNVRRGVNFAGEDLIEIIRLSFQTNSAVGDDLQLSSAQQTTLNERIRIARYAPKATVNLNSDQEAGVDEWYHTSTSAWQPGTFAPRWVNLIAATKAYCEKKGLTVSSISPFNEPDYTAWKQGSKAEFLAICKLLREREDMQGVALCGGNTLNNDEALGWYNYCKDYLDEGNTHQLAGSFDTFAKFYETVAADGKVAVGDELHNTMECMVGSEYGLTKGIWWGTCDHTRSQFMKASRGNRMGYAEHRNNWTAASVYRHPDGHVQGFGGTSERQAATTTYRFTATDHDVFYNGQGPTREYLMTLPGGTGYQKGQTNAETLVNIQDGDDIMPPLPTEPTTYKFVNRNSGQVMAVGANTTTSGLAMTQNKAKISGTENRAQQWIVRPIGARSGGDFSYYKIMNARDTTLLIDVRDWSLEDGGGLIGYCGGVGDNEQWFFEYAGDGWFYIRSRHSGLCIEVTPGSDSDLKKANRELCQGKIDGSPSQQWRLVPEGIYYNAKAPAAPTALEAEAQQASVRLTWTAPADTDLDHYIVQRSTDQQKWYTIHNSVPTTEYTDNTVQSATTYYYRVQAVDKSLNRSAVSEVACAAATGEQGMLCHLPFDHDLLDATGNGNHASLYASWQLAEGLLDSALVLDGAQNFLQLPATIATTDELTISMWVYWRGGKNWQRLFDFGTDEEHYVFLTTNAGSGPRLAIKNGGAEQYFSLGSSFGLNRWRHVAVTFGEDAITVYFDGKQVARKTDISIRPRDFRPIYNYIGRSQFPADPVLKGTIDDLRIYNYALTSSDVSRLFSDATSILSLPFSEALSSSSAEGRSSAASPYNLQGQRITKPSHLHPGNIYIQNHKKIIIP